MRKPPCRGLLPGGLLCLAGSLLTAVGWKDTRRLAQALARRLRGEGAPAQ